MTPEPPTSPADSHGQELPPGQHRVAQPPVMHYGRIPQREPSSWTVTVGGATATGDEHVFGLDQVTALPPVQQVADMHCATRWSALGVSWGGVRARDLVELAPPAEDVTDALVFAEFGYAANVPLADLLSSNALLVTHLGGEPLTPERGAPLRLVIPHLYTWKGPKWLRGWNYLLPENPDRGFWEDRGYHARGDAWREERFAKARPPSER
ncbi:molybdopterin-dependent oxidoreductase [Pseudactinotalea terrae]|uniref:molybdopterin-dependent oxidoreductase n=1 Tax=Pseudactinotalea terrae TaxID=1743262 RepID=UPI001F4F2973|nr:molybdopterin-dependent oxidoreductase [Pseudactinotalea terrae]